MPDLRWVHRIKHPGCSRVRNGSSVGSDIPRCVEGEVSVSSYADSFVRDRPEDNCAERGARGPYQLVTVHKETAQTETPISSRSLRRQRHCLWPIIFYDMSDGRQTATSR